MTPPPTWNTSRISDLAEVKYGKANPRQSGAIPIVGSGGVFGFTSDALVKRPTLVVGRKGTAGKVWLQEEPCWPSDTTFYLEWKTQGFDLRYLYYSMQSRQLSGEHARTTMPSIQRQDLEDYEVVLPPLQEQREIAQALRVLENASSAKEKELRLESERKSAVMQRLFAKGVNSGESKAEEVGAIPQGWSMFPLKQVADITYGIQAAVAHLVNPSGGVPILTNINIDNDGVLNLGTLRYFPLPDSMRESSLLKRGDVLFNWRSGSQSHVGKTVLFEEEGDYTFSSFILRLRPVATLNSTFLFYYLQAIKERGYFAQNRQQSSVNSVFNASVAGGIPTPVPTIEEQSHISSVLRACDSKLKALRREIYLLNECFAAALELLTTSKLRLHVQEPIL